MTTGKVILADHCPHALMQNGAQLLSVPPNWPGLRVDKLTIAESTQFGPQFAGTPMIFAQLSGKRIRWIRQGRQVVKISSSSLDLHIHGATYELDSGYGEGDPCHVLRVTVPQAFVRKYAPENSGIFDVDTIFGCVDDRLRNMIWLLAEEFESGLRNGELFSEGLSLSILGWLKQKYVMKTTVMEAQKLSFRQQKKLLDFIEDSLDSSITIDQMSQVLDLSPSYFCALFNASFGTSPHRFVMQRRINKAAYLLRSEPRKALADIANATGFSSQAHFTTSFKAYMKLTPARFRAG